jgi:hypothetical protein
MRAKISAAIALATILCAGAAALPSAMHTARVGGDPAPPVVDCGVQLDVRKCEDSAAGSCPPEVKRSVVRHAELPASDANPYVLLKGACDHAQCKTGQGDYGPAGKEWVCDGKGKPQPAQPQ